MLEVERLTAGYGGNPVIHNISLAVGTAEVVTVVGPNGAGKSTLLKAITGELPILSGHVRLDGTDLGRFRAHRRARSGIGYVPQSRDVFDTLTVAENLLIGGHLLGRQQASARMKEVLEMFPALGRMRERTAGKLSGGERKMLAIARTLMLSPRVLILDEPSANLAPELAKQVLNGHVRRLANSGMGILLVEQKVFEALAISDWAHVLVAGQPRLEGAAADLLAQPGLRDVFLGAGADAAPPPAGHPLTRPETAASLPTAQPARDTPRPPE